MMKTLVVAKSEFLTAIRSKGFIIGVLMSPIAIGISVLVQALTAGNIDVSDRKFAVVDRSGAIYEILETEAAKRNEKIAAHPGPLPQSRFFPSQVAPGETRDETAHAKLRLELSDKVRHGDLLAFVEIPEDIFDANDAESNPTSGSTTKPDAADPAPGSSPASSPDASPDSRASRPGEIAYYSDKPTYDELPNWIAQTVNDAVRKHKLKRFSMTDEQYQYVVKEVPSKHFGLTTKTETGEIKAAQAVSPVDTFWIPFIMMFLLWMVVMSAVPQLLSTAIEEKMIRVSEVILGSVTPFELMMGKLLSSTGISAVLATLYLTGGAVIAAQFNHADSIPFHLIPVFVFFMLLAVFFFGSVFIAIGAACSEIKDAQGLMAPAMMILMIPIFVWVPILKHPNSPLAVVASLFPPATPMLMLLRLASHPTPPAWQVVLGVVLTTATTITCVWAAGRIFRIGILSQGKTPSIRELIRWVTRA